MRTIQFVHLVAWCGVVLAGCAGDQTAAPLESAGLKKPPDQSQPSRSAFSFANERGRTQETAVSLGTRGVAFIDVARERGLIHTWPQQPRPMTALHAFGAGCAAFDADDDGWQDVLLVADPHPRLFRNLGRGRFEDVTAASGLTVVEGDWGGGAVADYDGDGRLDLVITGYHRVAVYRNLGGMQFEDVTLQVGLEPLNEGRWASSAGFMDLDGDRWLDLVVLNYVVFDENSQQYCEYAAGIRSGCNPKIYPPERGRIWRNNRAGGFEAVPQSQGMDQTHGVALVVAFTDLDRDGLFDFYIGNDGIVADFLHNLGGMRFENIAAAAGVAVADDANAVSAMGADWADFDRDGQLDLAVSNWQGSAFVLFRGLGRNLFMDSANRTGLTRNTKNRLGFGAKWVDFDNDGWSDLFFVNGHVYDTSAEIHGPGVPFRQQLSLLLNDRGKAFVDVLPAQGDDVKRSMVGRGSATADFDNDGRVDLLAVDFEGPAMLLENRTESANHWLTLDLRGAAPNVFAYGARVMGKSGGHSWLAEVSPASSYLSSSDPRIHWGLGDLTKLESVTIRWPSGGEQKLENVAADQILRVMENEP